MGPAPIPADDWNCRDGDNGATGLSWPGSLLILAAQWSCHLPCVTLLAQKINTSSHLSILITHSKIRKYFIQPKDVYEVGLELKILFPETN